MPVCTRSAAARALTKSASVPQRQSMRIARADWLKRLRPRAAAPVKQVAKRRRAATPVKRRRARLFAEPGVELRRSARLLQQQQYRREQLVLLELVANFKEDWVMTVNPMFIAPAAPRACTGWSCCCASPHGFGQGRTNYCRFYSIGPSPVEEADPFVFPAEQLQPQTPQPQTQQSHTPAQSPKSPRLPRTPVKSQQRSLDKPRTPLTGSDLTIALGVLGFPPLPKSPAAAPATTATAPAATATATAPANECCVH